MGRPSDNRGPRQYMTFEIVTVQMIGGWIYQIWLGGMIMAECDTTYEEPKQAFERGKEELGQIIWGLFQ